MNNPLGKTTKRKSFKICFNCHSSTAVVPIIQGLPTDDDLKMAEAGEVILAGCVVDSATPKWACKECGRSW